MKRENKIKSTVNDLDTTQKEDYSYNNLVFQTHYVLKLHKQLPIIL